MVTYRGEYNGRTISSLHPNVFRVQYSAYIGRGMVNVDKTVTGYDAIDVAAVYPGLTFAGPSRLSMSRHWSP